MKDRIACGTSDLTTLYDAAFDGNLLKTLVAMLASTIPAEVAVLLFSNDRGQPGCNVLLQHDPHSPHRPASQDWGQGHWATPVGSVYHDRDLSCGTRSAAALDCAVGVVLSRAAETQTVLELRYPFANSDNGAPGPPGPTINGTPAASVAFQAITGLAIDKQDNIYVADATQGCVFKINAA